MRRLLTVFLAILLLASCSIGHRDDEKNTMVGVKTMRVTQVKADTKFGVFSLGDTVSVMVFHYDEDGKILRSEHYDERGLIETNTYQWNGNHYEAIQTYYSFSRYLSDKTYTRRAEYDEHGRVTYMCRLDSDGDIIISDDSFEYDENGNLSKEVSTNVFDGEAHTWTATYVYTYGTNGRIDHYKRMASAYDESGIYEKDYSYKYNKDGSYLIEEDSADKQRHVDKYDRNGRLIESYTDNESSPDYKDVYEYNNKGRTTRKTSFVDDVPKEIVIYDYELY